MTITLRMADNVEDFDKILFCAQSIGIRYQYGIVDLEPLSVSFVNAIKRIAILANFHAIIAEDESGACVGGLGFLISDYILMPEKKVFEELFWWSGVRGTSGARLLLQAKRVAKDSGCFKMILHTLDGEDKTEASRAYTAIGGKLVQLTYMVGLCSQPVH